MLSSAKRFIVCFVWCVSGLGLLGCNAVSAPTPTPTVRVTILTVAPTTVPTPTPTAAPTQTNTPTATRAPTLTPTPTQLPSPTATPPPGWKKLESAQVELWVPGSFIGGDPVKDRDPMIKSLRAMGSEYNGYINFISQSPSLFTIYAIDSLLGSTGFITAISVTVNQIVSTGTGEVLQGGVSQQLPKQYTTLDRRGAVAGVYGAERMVADSLAQNIRVRQLVYTIKTQNTAWVVAFTTTEGEFYTRLPAFEQSIATLRFKR
ncbi:MAG: hypothetical protein AB1817_06095 [Chloroflexota bacterium]